MNDLISLYQDMAADGRSFRGLSVLQHAEQIGKIVRRHDAENLLDYGCGAGDAYRSPHKLHRTLGLRRASVTLYDPAFPSHDAPPRGMWDVVVCSDVLEHVPEPQVSLFVDQLFRHAKRHVWASVCCRPAKKSFPGSDVNLHVTLHPYAWWNAHFLAAQSEHGGVAYTLVETP